MSVNTLPALQPKQGPAEGEAVEPRAGSGKGEPSPFFRTHTAFPSIRRNSGHNSGSSGSEDDDIDLDDIQHQFHQTQCTVSLIPNDPPPPRPHASLLSRLSLWWANPLFALGYHMVLQLRYLWTLETPETCTSSSLDFDTYWQEELDNAKDGQSQPSVRRALRRQIAGMFMASSLLYLVFAGAGFMLPIMQGEIITYLRKQQRPVGYGYLYIGVLIVSIIVGSFAQHHSQLLGQRAGIQIRNALMAAVYKKSLRLSSKARETASTGRIVNLMSNDAHKLLESMRWINSGLAAPFQIIGAIAYLSTIMGWYAFVPVGIMLVLSPLTYVCAQRLFTSRFAMIASTDARIKSTSELLQNIRVVKFYAWERFFVRKILGIRENELVRVRQFTLYRMWIVFIATSVPVLAGAVTFVVYSSFAKDDLTVEIAFPTLTVLDLIRVPLILFPITVSSISQNRIALNRIQEFLCQPELEQTQLLCGDAVDAPLTAHVRGERFTATGPSEGDADTVKGVDKGDGKSDVDDVVAAKESSSPTSSSTLSSPLTLSSALTTSPSSSPSSPLPSSAVDSVSTQSCDSHDSRLRIRIRDGTFAWGTQGPTLHDVTVHIGDAQLTMIVGPVGSGKSSLLSAMLGEMERVSGTIERWDSMHHRHRLHAANASTQRRIGDGSGPSSGSPLFRVDDADGLDDVVDIDAGDSVDAFLDEFGLDRVEDESAIAAHQHVSRVAYCAQTAWILNATVRENVLFGLPFDADRYAEVVYACALSDDIDLLPAGDATEIGERGINLSGGQKQRLSIARALYSDADLYFFDDPLSAVDAHVGEHIFEHCFRRYLAGKCVVLATNQLHFLSSSSHIYVLDGGRVAEEGTYAQLMSDKSAFSILMDTHGVADMMSTDDIPCLDIAKDQVKQHVDASDDDGDGDDDGKGDVVVVLPAEQSIECDQNSMDDRGSLSSSQRKMSDALKDVTIGGGGGGGGGKRDVKGPKDQPKGDKTGELVSAESREDGAVSFEVYLFYILQGAGYVVFGIILVLLFLYMCVRAVSGIWLALWLDDKLKKSINYYMWFYVGWSALDVILLLVITYVFAIFAVKASRRLHVGLLERLVHAPTYFFDVTPLGRILNRFSRDIDTIDMLLGFMTQQFLRTIFLLVSVVVVLGYSARWPLLAVGPMAIVYYYVQKYFRHTSRDLQRLNSVTLSPIFSHFSATLNGTSTIRAYACSERFRRRNSSHIDDNNRAFYHLQVANAWMGMRLDWIGLVVITSTLFSVVVVRSDDDIGLSALALTYAFMLTSMLNYASRNAAEMEVQMNAPERIREYSNVIQEADSDTPFNHPQRGAIERHEWPSEGRVTFEHVQMRYREGLDLVLRDLTFDVPGGAKVGIVGRTGAGKSSIMLALLRIVERCGGCIKVDDVDIETLGLRDVREALAIIPQEPVLFSTDIRSNLDPFQECDDDELWTTLRLAHLEDFVRSLEGGLDAKVSEDGANFSLGQRQLICLARALLRKPKVLLMDEATASVDVATDALIQQTVREHFTTATVITIAHRLNTIMDSDIVIVMGDGRVLEMGPPAELLEDEDGALSSLVDATGVASAAHLRSLADDR